MAFAKRYGDMIRRESLHAMLVVVWMATVSAFPGYGYEIGDVTFHDAFEDAAQTSNKVRNILRPDNKNAQPDKETK